MKFESTFQHRKPIKENSKANSKKCLMENYFKWKSNNIYCIYSLYAARVMTKPPRHRDNKQPRTFDVLWGIYSHSASTHHPALVFHGYWTLLPMQLPISPHTRNYSSTHYYYYRYLWWLWVVRFVEQNNGSADERAYVPYPTSRVHRRRRTVLMGKWVHFIFFFFCFPTEASI